MQSPRRNHLRTALCAALTSVGFGTSAAHANPLDPNAFAALGTLNVASGAITINTDTRTITGAASFAGVSFDQGNGNPTIAVFDFHSATIGSGVSVSIVGTSPLALLSRGSMSIG